MKTDQQRKRAVEMMDARVIINNEGMHVPDGVAIQVHGSFELIVKLVSHAGLAHPDRTVNDDDHEISLYNGKYILNQRLNPLVDHVPIMLNFHKDGILWLGEAGDTKDNSMRIFLIQRDDLHADRAQNGCQGSQQTLFVDRQGFFRLPAVGDETNRLVGKRKLIGVVSTPMEIGDLLEFLKQDDQLGGDGGVLRTNNEEPIRAFHLDEHIIEGVIPAAARPMPGLQTLSAHAAGFQVVIDQRQDLHFNILRLLRHYDLPDHLARQRGRA